MSITGLNAKWQECQSLVTHVMLLTTMSIFDLHAVDKDVHFLVLMLLTTMSIFDLIAV